MTPRSLLGFRFTGTLSTMIPEDRPYKLCWVQSGLEADPFGDTLHARCGDFSVFLFSTRTTYIAILGCDLGCVASDDPSLPPSHRGYLVTGLHLSGHLQEAMEGVSRLLGELKAYTFPQLEGHGQDLAALEETRAFDRSAMRTLAQLRFIDRERGEDTANLGPRDFA